MAPSDYKKGGAKSVRGSGTKFKEKTLTLNNSVSNRKPVKDTSHDKRPSATAPPQRNNVASVISKRKSSPVPEHKSLSLPCKIFKQNPQLNKSGSIESFETDMEGVLSASESENNPQTFSNVVGGITASELSTQHPKQQEVTGQEQPQHNEEDFSPSPIIGKSKFVRLNLDEHLASHSDSLPNNIRQVFLSSTDNRVRLSSINPFKIGSGIDKICGPVESVVHKRSGSLLITTKSMEQVHKILQCKTFPENDIPVSAKISWSSQISYGKIYAPEFLDSSLEEILSYLKPEGVIGIRKLLNDPRKVKVPLYVLSFIGNKCPDRLKTRYSYYKVDPFYPKPTQCTNCYRMGHTASRCHGNKICAKCGSTEHSIEDCQNRTTCKNCKGPHLSTSRECPTYIKEMNICRIKTDRGISYQEARQIVYNEVGRMAPENVEPFTDDILSPTHFPSLPIHCQVIPSQQDPELQQHLYQNPRSSQQYNEACSLSQAIGQEELIDLEQSSVITPAQRTPENQHKTRKSQMSDSVTCKSCQWRLHRQSQDPHLSNMAELPNAQTENPNNSPSNLNLISHDPNTVEQRNKSLSNGNEVECIKELISKLMPSIIKLFLAKTITEKVEIFLEIGNLFDASNVITNVLKSLGLTSLSNST